MSAPFDMTWFNAALMIALAIVPVTYLLVPARRDPTAAEAYRVAHRAGLPFGSDEIHARVRRRLRRLRRANMWGVLAALAVFAPVLLWTPAGSSPLFLWLVVLTLMIVVLTTCSLVIVVGDQLRRPAPDAPRIARARRMTIADYLQPWRRLLAPIALAAAVGTTTLLVLYRLVAPARLSFDNLLWPLIALAFAVIVSLGIRPLERIILARPQPAHDELDLAWDDLFRADALWTLRTSATMAAALPLGLALGTLVLAIATAQPPRILSVLYMGPLVLISAVQVLYALGHGTMPDDRYPAALRSPRARPSQLHGDPA